MTTVEMESPELTKKQRRELKKQRKLEARHKHLRQQRLKRVLLWSFALLGIVALFFTSKLQNNSSDLPTLTLQEVATSDQMKGNAEADVLLVEYSDFQCPACGRYYPLLKQLDQEFGDQIKFVYRHFPLRQIHPDAQLAAQAAEAAGQQGQFWEMHDLLFENQQEWSESKNAKQAFIEYAVRLNLNLDQFEDDLNSRAIKNKITHDYSSGIKAGVDSTPSFFLNGQKIKNPSSYEELKLTLEKVLNQ